MHNYCGWSTPNDDRYPVLLYNSVNLALDYEPLPGILTQIIVPQINGAGKKTCATGKSGTLVNFKKGSRGVVIPFLQL